MKVFANDIILLWFNCLLLFFHFQTPVMVTSALQRTCANWTRTGNPCADVTGCARWSSRLCADPTGAPTPTSASCAWRRAKNGRRSAFSSEESAAQVPKYSATFFPEILRNNFGIFFNSKNLKIEFFLRFAADFLLNLIVFHGDS